MWKFKGLTRSDILTTNSNFNVNFLALYYSNFSSNKREHLWCTVELWTSWCFLNLIVCLQTCHYPTREHPLFCNFSPECLQSPFSRLTALDEKKPEQGKQLPCHKWKGQEGCALVIACLPTAFLGLRNTM